MALKKATLKKVFITRNDKKIIYLYPSNHQIISYAKNIEEAVQKLIYLPKKIEEGRKQRGWEAVAISIKLSDAEKQIMSGGNYPDSEIIDFLKDLEIYDPKLESYEKQIRSYTGNLFEKDYLDIVGKTKNLE